MGGLPWWSGRPRAFVVCIAPGRGDRGQMGAPHCHNSGRSAGNVSWIHFRFAHCRHPLVKMSTIFQRATPTSKGHCLPAPQRHCTIPHMISVSRPVAHHSLRRRMPAGAVGVVRTTASSPGGGDGPDRLDPVASAATGGGVYYGRVLADQPTALHTSLLLAGR